MGRRLVRRQGASERVWEVEVDGAELVIATGRPGRLKTRRQRFGDAEAAAKALVDAVRQMVDGGWEEELPEVVVSGDELDPDDVQQMLVLADTLTEADDPRGALIALEIALESRADEALEAERAKLWADHGARWACRIPEDVQVTWKRGFIERFEASCAPGLMAEVLQALESTGSLRFLRDVEVYGASLQAVLEGLAAGTWPWLERLVVRSRAVEARELAAVVGRMPRLRMLDVEVGGMPVGRLEGRVRALRLVGEAVDLVGLSEAVLPDLERLAVGIRSPGLVDREALQRCGDRPLQVLVLEQHAVNEWAAAVSRRPSVARVELVDCERSGEAGFWLEEHQAHLRGLPIEVRGFELSEEDLRRLSDLDLTVPLPDVAAPRRVDHRSPRQEVWRRFERERPSGRRFWSVVREDAAVVVRHGKVGATGREQRTEFPSVRRAAGEVARRVRRKVAEGWEEVAAEAAV